MTTGRTFALTAGLVGAFALGVAVGPSVWDGFDARNDRMVSVEPAPADTPPPAPVTRPSVSAKARSALLMRERDARADKSEAAETRAVASRPATAPELQARLKPVLNRGAKMDLAAVGFRDAEQFATVAHAARNTEVPFMVLKHRVLNEHLTLAAAIRESKPDLDAAAEVQKARDQARADLVAIAN